VPPGFGSPEPEAVSPELIRYRSQVHVLGHVALALGVVILLFAVLIAIVGVLGGLGILDPHDTMDDRIGGAIGAAVTAGLGFLMGGLNVAAGIGLRRAAPWARTLGLVAAFVDLLGGCGCLLTLAFSIWALVLLFDQRATTVFATGLDAGASK